MYEIYKKRETKSIFSTILVNKKGYDKSIIIKNGVVSAMATQEAKMMLPDVVKISDALALVGILPLFNGTEPNFYLLLVSSSQRIGEIGQSKYYQIQNVSLVPFKNCDVAIHTILTNSQKQTANSIPPDDVIMSEFYKFITSGTFYYAERDSRNSIIYDDISTSYQKKYQQTNMQHQFLWNRVMRSFFTRTDDCADLWTIYMICGSVEISQQLLHCSSSDLSPRLNKQSEIKRRSSLRAASFSMDIRNENLTFAVISRLSWQRMGVRYTCRGLDDDGNVANFVETEQIVYHKGSLSSFMQIRGTVPLFWEQTGFQMLGHKIDFNRTPVFSVEAMKRHFCMLKEEYGKYITCVSLSSLVKTSEASLSTTYKDTLLVTDMPNVKIILFDFHEKCSGAYKNENLARLYEELSPLLDKSGVFSSTLKSPEENNIIFAQDGALRVNCVDCIDRTNALQTFVGMEMLERQIKSIGIYNFSQSDMNDLKNHVQKLWYKNGNACSKNYAGTDAMESGKSSLYSRLKDSALSVQRTCMNHFSDSGTGRNIAFSSFKIANQPSIMFPDLLRDRSCAHLPYHFRHHFHSTRVLVERLIQKPDKYIVDLPMRITIGTWNVNSGYKKNNESAFFNPTLSDWLLNSPMAEPKYTIDISCKDIYKPPDMIVIGLQELVDLNATNIIVNSSEQVLMWAENILGFITNDVNYTLICAEQLVGVGLIIFVQSKWIPHISDIRTCVVKTGFKGKTGNKGAIITDMLINSSRICFVSAHLAAGQSQTMQRNDDYNEIVNQYQAKTNRHFFNNDHIFWCGDLNYRIQLSSEEVKNAILCKDFATLLAADQLKEAMMQSMAFSEFKEATIVFDPTYKYDTNSTIYDTSEKCRIPAWCDRVLWYSRKKLRKDVSGQVYPTTRPLYYGRSEIMSSDHRPVVSIFDVEVEKVSRAAFVAEFDNVLQEEKYIEPELILEPSVPMQKDHYEAVSNGICEIIRDFVHIKVKPLSVSIKLASGSNMDSYLRREFPIDLSPLPSYILKPKVGKAITYFEVEATLLSKLKLWAAEEDYQLTRSEQSLIDLEKHYQDLSKCSIDDYKVNRNCLLPQLPIQQMSSLSMNSSDSFDISNALDMKSSQEDLGNSCIIIPPVPTKQIMDPFDTTNYPDFFQTIDQNQTMQSPQPAPTSDFSLPSSGSSILTSSCDSAFTGFGASDVNLGSSSFGSFKTNTELVDPFEASSYTVSSHGSSSKRNPSIPPRPQKNIPPKPLRASLESIQVNYDAKNEANSVGGFGIFPSETSIPEFTSKPVGRSASDKFPIQTLKYDPRTPLSTPSRFSYQSQSNESPARPGGNYSGFSDDSTGQFGQITATNQFSNPEFGTFSNFSPPTGMNSSNFGAVPFDVPHNTFSSTSRPRPDLFARSNQTSNFMTPTSSNIPPPNLHNPIDLKPAGVPRNPNAHPPQRNTSVVGPRKPRMINPTVLNRSANVRNPSDFKTNSNRPDGMRRS